MIHCYFIYIFAVKIFSILKVFKNFIDNSSQKPLALSLGMFDGVHLGHKSIISELMKVGEDNNLELSYDELSFAFKGYLNKTIPDYPY